MGARDPYRLVARFYDRLVEPMQEGVRRIAVDVISPEPGWQVLDVGCGTGTGLAAYATTGCTVVGVDVSEAMLRRARARMGEGVELHKTDGDALPFDDRRFDLVTTSMVLHEVPAEARERFVEEMARVTKADGRMVLVDFSFGELRGWKGPTLRILSEIIERFSGHYSGYRSFKASGGVSSVLKDVGLPIAHEKIVAGGNIAVSIVVPTSGAHSDN